ncbi:MAG: hypothetical protein M1454_05035 [Candidatus Thermoplasmatota archaeon]|nr:hypothetical protein [Candidatus Thermoplasmatota archaeon]MCL5731441.1 hypothetical protein [Candidatus Thermoplasmatota archaeon]
MGRTTPTVRQKIDSISKDCMKMKDMMEPADGELLERMLNLGKVHSPEINFSGLPVEFGYLLSIVFELFKIIRDGNR